MASQMTKTASHATGTRGEWLAARLELLEAEKELTRRHRIQLQTRDAGGYATLREEH